ncbi:hypothetical protein MMC25_004111 [Agyrium rufum]|nr:hypothetical protein [Agyrium rufum]
MTTFQPVNDCIILYVKEGVKLGNATTSEDPTAKTFVQLTETLKAQRGYLYQYWGHQVENPNIFLWFIDWATHEDFTTYTSSESFNESKKNLAEVFDVAAKPPMIFLTKFHDPTSMVGALRSPVTEVAFYTLPDSTSHAHAAEVVDRSLGFVMSAVTTAGKAHAGATGWIFSSEPKGAAAPTEGTAVALHGVFGYDSIEAHMRWRETPEHAQVMVAMGEVDKEIELRDADIFGGPCMFHVHFEEGK